MASRKINVGIIGTGWIGEIRAKVCANHPLVESVHLAEIDPAKLARIGEETRAKTATTARSNCRPERSSAPASNPSRRRHA